jgi:hypothetical protein
MSRQRRLAHVLLLQALCCLRADSRSSLCSTSVSVSSISLPELGMIGALATGASGQIIVGTDSALYVLHSSGLLSLVAGHPRLPGFKDGSGTLARFNQIRGAEQHSNGKLYIIDHGNHRIRTVVGVGSPDGAVFVSTLAGNGQAGNAEGVGTSARFHSPWGIAIDVRTGMMWVSDQSNNRVCSVTPEVTPRHSLTPPGPLPVPPFCPASALK